VSEVPSYPSEKVVAYDATWPDTFATFAEPLRAGLGATWEVEHVGSTSVPGLLAKPVIDLAVRIPRCEHVEDHLATLQELGWTEFTDLGTHHVLFRIDASGVRRAIAHFFDEQQWPYAHQRLFPMWLRAHSHDRDEYADLKRELVNAGVWGHEYTAAKRPFIQDIVNRARAELGLAPVSV
jgi:GrpB-like predicted nucleotidyltransferase (UPF0157 family)